MRAPPFSPPPDWVALAVITQPHGVGGRVKIKSFTEPPEAFATYTPLTDQHGAPVRLRITGQAQGQYIVAIEGLDDRTAAELWRGRQLGATRLALPDITEPDRFYIAELEGMAVVTPAGAAFGTVHGVSNFGAGDLLEITLASGEREFFSFTHATFPHIDRAARRITIDPPHVLGSRAEEEGA